MSSRDFHVKPVRLAKRLGIVLATSVLAAVIASPRLLAQAGSASTPQAAPTGAVVSGAPKISCASYVEVLAGKKKGSAILKDPLLRQFAQGQVDLLTCGAVAADSDELCGLLSGQTASDCRLTRERFHELRTVKGRSFLMTDQDYKSCRQDKTLAPFCDALREAARSADPNKCPKGMIEGFCRGLVSMDKSQCAGVGTIEDSEQGKAACEKIIDRNKPYAQGLKELAQSGAEPDRDFAKAALGQSDACKALGAKAMQACEEIAAPPSAAGGDSKEKSAPVPVPDGKGSGS